jgi:hypothetical protein
MIADSPGGMGPVSGNMQLVYLILTSTSGIMDCVGPWVKFLYTREH